MSKWKSEPVVGREEEILSDLKTLISCASSAPERAGPTLQAGERRNCGVVFLDLEGFTDLSRVISSEDLAVLVDRVFKLFTFEARKEGGYLDKVVGDAALFVFPGSEAHRPVIDAALLAALGMQSRCDEINASLNAPEIQVSVRIGVNYGEVTRLQVGGSEQPETVMGEAVNLAQRLETACPSGSVLTSADIAESAGPEFEFGSPRTEDLKGFGEHRVRELLGYSESRTTTEEVVEDTRSPFIGRERERSQILDFIRSAGESGSALPALWITGESAVGKTRLIMESLEQVEQGGYRTAGANTPAPPSQWFAVPKLLARNLRDLFGGDPGPAELRDELARDLRMDGGGDEAAVQRLELGVDFLFDLDRGETSQQLGRMETEVKLELSEFALARMLAYLTSRSREGLVVVLEDMQWVDDASAELLALLIEDSSIPGLSFILSRRSGLGNPLEDRLKGVDELRLERFDRDEAEEMIDRLLPGVDFEAGLLDEIIDRAGGIPFFIEEFCLYLKQRGYLERESDGTWRLARTVEQLEVPDNIEQMVLARLDRLAPEIREIVRHCAVLGRRFSRELLVKTERKLESGIGEADIDRALSVLVDRGIFERSHELEEFRFRHLLTRESAYETTLISSRRALHRLAAENLQEIHPPNSAGYFEALPQMIAHFEMAEEPLSALDQTLKFLQVATNLGAAGRWKEYHEKARELFDEVDWGDTPDDPAADKLHEVQWDPPGQFDYLRSLPAQDGVALRERYGIRMAVAESANFWRRGEWEEDIRSAIWVLLSHPLLEDMPEQYIQLSIVAAGIQYQQGDMEEAARTVQHALNRFRGEIDPSLKGRALTQLGLIRFKQGHGEDAENLFREAIELYRESSDLLRLGAVYANLARLVGERRDFKEAMELYDRALEIHERFGMRRSEAIARSNLASLHYRRGEMEQASELLEDALSIHREQGNRPKEALVLGNLALLKQEQGLLTDAEQHYRDALRLNRELSNRNSEGVALGNLAGLKRLQNEPREARELYRQSVEILREVQNPKFLYEMLAHRADLECELSDLDRAEELLDEASTLEDELQDIPSAVVRHAASGRVHLRRDREQQALEELERAAQLAEQFDVGRGVEYSRPLLKLSRELEERRVGNPTELLPKSWDETESG